MKKDYIAVQPDARHMDERTFIETYWTRTWEHADHRQETCERVEQSEEFRMIAPYVSTLPPHSRLLDGGCGLGAWTAYYASNGFRVTGLDISRATIERARQRLPRLEFAVGDIRQTGFEDATFDAYFSWGTFEHFEEGLGTCIQEAWRILKPGGYLFLSVPFQNLRLLMHDIWPVERADHRRRQRPDAAKPMRFYQWHLTKRELRRELTVHGFHVLQLHAVHKDTGLHRALKNDIGFPPGSLAYRLTYHLMLPVTPSSWVAHMLLGVCRKPAS